MASCVQQRPTDGASNRSRTVVAVAAALGVLALVAVGCSTSPDNNESNGAIEGPTPTTAAIQQVEPTQPQPETEPSEPEPSLTTTPATRPDPAPTTTQPDDTDPAATTTQPDDTKGGVDDAPDGGEPVTRISAVHHLVPWREGFLQVGYPIVDEDQADRTRLFSRASADGLHWSPLARLPAPLPDPQIDDFDRWPRRRWSRLSAASDGERLILAVQEGEDILVAITSDLTHWATFEIPPPSSDGLPYGVKAKPSGVRSGHRA